MTETPIPCQRCQGNGEIVTNWERYLEPHDGDKGDEAVAECSDCGGEGIIDINPVHPYAATQGEAAVSTAPMNVSLPVTDERSGEGANAGGSHVTPGRNAHPQPSAVEPVSSSTEFAYLEDAGSGA
ncbi:MULTISPECIES: hypothetical protein [unclassified Rhizobium]|uniref:hypothetical protein n=1 Tax=unclassified Rhizobium TaxID=2613769 RepID=UPI00288C26D6|nr:MULTISPECIES: hypothetical protein [unclassified Rhizobium]